MSTPNALVVLPSSGSLSLRAQETVLAVGRTFVARVAAVNDEGLLFLRVGNGLIAAKSDQDLPVGTQLRLQVQDVGENVVLKLLPPESEQAPTPAIPEQDAASAEPLPQPSASPTIEVPLESLLRAAPQARPQQQPATALTDAPADAQAPIVAEPGSEQVPLAGQSGPQSAAVSQPPADAAESAPNANPPVSSQPPDSPSGVAPQAPGGGAAPTSTAPVGEGAPSVPVTAGVPAADDTQQLISAGARLGARVVSNSPEGVQVKLAGGGELTLPARAALAPAGAAVEVEVVQVQGDQAQVRLVLPQRPATQESTDIRGQLVQTVTAELTDQLGANSAAGVAEFIAARGVSSPETAMLTARVLTGKVSPIALLRQIAKTDPAAAQLLDAIETAAVSGDGSALRKALSKLGLDQEKQLVLGTADSDTVKATGRAAEQVVTSQQVLMTKPSSDTSAPLFLFLPLPDGGQARLVIDEDSGGQGSGGGGYSVRGELDLAHVGSLSFHVMTTDSGAFLLVEAETPDVAAHLEQGLPALQEAVEKVLKRPVVATVVMPPPGMPRLSVTPDFGKQDIYA